MRVLILDLMGITPLYDYYLCQSLMQSGVDVQLATISPFRDPDFYTKYRVPKYSGILDFSSRFTFFGHVFKIKLVSIEHALNLIILTLTFLFKKPKVIHIQWVTLFRILVLEMPFLYLWRLLGIRLVYTVHDILPHDSEKRHFSTYLSLYKVFDSLICHTEHSAQQLRKDFNINPEKVFVIPHGPLFHDRNNRTAKTPWNLKKQSNDVMVLHLGNLKPYKGVEFLLEVWRMVIDHGGQGKLVIAGQGSERYCNELDKRIEELELTAVIDRHYRYIPDEEFTALLNSANILVCPHRAVTQSGILIAGLSRGVPILTTRTPGREELIQHEENGLSAEFGDVDMFAAQLLRLMTQPQLRKTLGRSGRELILNDCSWEGIAHKTQAVYKNITA